jgi:hypothetical protein
MGGDFIWEEKLQAPIEVKLHMGQAAGLSNAVKEAMRR